LHDYREIVDGLVLLVVIIFAPAGLAGLWRGLKPRERRPAAALPQ